MKIPGLLVLLLSSLHAELNVMPMPAKVTLADGTMTIDQTFRVVITGAPDPRIKAAAERMVAQLSKRTGMPVTPGSSPSFTIHIDKASEPVQKLNEDESYKLTIEEQQANLDAPTTLGALRGMETFLQLVAPDAHGFSVPELTIEDRPRFPWRGLSLDVSRHWIPAETVRRTLDGMAAVKLNVLHWHLSDDQGFRVESKLFPKLQGKGSDGNYYTQEEIREIVAYAHWRGIRVVPEFDIPGHSQSWLAGYPELGTDPGPYEIGRHWGVFVPVMDPTKESVYQFLDAFIGEMVRLFPDKYFHIGGDEVNGKAWSASAHTQAFIKAHGLQDNHGLQAYFNKRLLAIVKKHGKNMEGWDEILHPDLPKDIVIQSWRGQKSLAEAARQGYQGLLSAGYYLDLMQPAAAHYAIDPLEGETANLNDEEKKRILGGEAAMWEEYANAENFEARLWPRLAAIAERLWSPQDTKDVASMYRRMDYLSRNLEFLGITHRSSFEPMLQRLAGSGLSEPLRVLAEVVEPVKGYKRNSTHKYTSFSPLNRLVDTARPESDRARQFAELKDAETMRRWLTRWRDNDAALEPVIAQSFLLTEIAPISQSLTKVSSIGLEALDYIAAKKAAPANWVAQQTAVLDDARKVRAELLLVIVDAVQKLVNTAAKK